VEIDSRAIDRIVKEATKVLENSKNQIYEIFESAQKEKEALQVECRQVQSELDQTISEVDRLESRFKLARIRLREVSRNFEQFSEEAIRIAYENATSIQLELFLAREKEQQLRIRREELQQRVRNLERTLERAEGVGLQMSVVLDYLSGDIAQAARILESVKNHQLLGLKILMAQEEERKRLARELHDGIAQTIANVVLRAEIAERMMEKGQTSGMETELAALKKQARSSMEEIRKMIFNLRPMALDDLGLVPLLRKFTQDFEEKEKIHTTFEYTGNDYRLPSSMEAAIFRLVQEGFLNVLKHAQATHVALELAFQSQMLKLVIQDNGKGFHVESVQEKMTDGSHFGLLGMKERVELLDGRLDIESEPHAGTKLTILIPVRLDMGKEHQHVTQENSDHIRR
jgi:two-component system sensor histidine kinase DegS